MGKFTYESDVRVELEDRVLAHLQVVVSTKLRRGEAFTFTWKEDPSVGGGRTTVWMHPRASIVYKFHGSRIPRLNPDWLEALMYSANAATGLYVVPEPAPRSTVEEDAQEVMYERLQPVHG